MMAVSKGTGMNKLVETSGECKEIQWVVYDFFSKFKAKVSASWESQAFYFNDDAWWLLLNFVVKNNQIYVQLVLSRELKIKCQVKYYVGLKNSNNKELHSHSGILSQWGTHCNVNNLHHKSLLRRIYEYESCDALTIMCTLKKLKAGIVSTSKTEMKLINLEKLSDNFKNLFENKETCDTTLKVNEKEFRAHRSVLIARSNVFAATFKYDSLESQTGVVNILDCDPDTFQKFLEYLYCGKLEHISSSSALNLYYIAAKYDVQELAGFCVEYLMPCLTAENICEIAVLADKFNEMKLFSAVQEFFNENCFEIFLTSEWDDLQTEDIRLANKLLKRMSELKLKMKTLNAIKRK